MPPKVVADFVRAEETNLGLLHERSRDVTPFGQLSCSSRAVKHP